MLVTDGPPFALAISIPVCFLSFVVLLIQLKQFPDRSSQYILTALWLRYSVAMFHDVTYRPLVGSLSIVAVMTVAMVVVGLAIVDLRVFRFAYLSAFYCFAFILVMSGLCNGLLEGLFNNLIKFTFFTLIAGGVYEALIRYGPARFYRAVATLLATPIVLQWISYVTDLKKISESSTEADLAVSFIGGYQHQAGFAVIILTFMVACILWRPRRLIVSCGTMAITLFGLIICDYRTAMIASMLPIGAIILSEMARRFKAEERPVILSALAVVLILIIIPIAAFKQERFADIANIIDKGGALIKPPEYYTDPEQKMLSGRLHLWSDYITHYNRSDTGSMLIGHGPDSWNGVFSLYAHNNYVSYLYEYGAVGLVLYLCFVVYNVSLCFNVRGVNRITLLTCHLSFMILSLGTMPMWMVEGGVLYALIIACTWYGQLEAALQPDRSPNINPSEFDGAIVSEKIFHTL